MGGTSWQAEVGAGNATKKFKALTRAHPQGTLDSTGLNQYHGTLYAYNCIIFYQYRPVSSAQPPLMCSAALYGLR